MTFKKLLAIAPLAALFSVTNAALTKRVTCSDGNTATNEACCTWFPVLTELQDLFNNECGREAREALRLTFHDAMGFSPTLGGGGADGSIITFASTELAYAANDDGGVSDIVDNLAPLVSKFNVTPGDLIYFAAAVGTTHCAGAPALQFLTGRPPPLAAAPDGLISLPTGMYNLYLALRLIAKIVLIDSAATIIERFGEVGFSPVDIVSLLASHSIAAADGLTGAAQGDPFDSTPTSFDSQFFVETRMNSAIPGAARIPSDVNLATDDSTSCAWQNFIENESTMRSNFAAVMQRLAVVAQDTSSLIDCSEVIPGQYIHTEHEGSCY